MHDHAWDSQAGCHHGDQPHARLLSRRPGDPPGVSRDDRMPRGAAPMAPDESAPPAAAAFAARTTVEQVEEGLALAPRFDADGLIPCITTDAEHGRRADAGLHEWRGSAANDRDRRSALLEPKPPVPLAQGRNQRPCPGGCRDAHRRRPGRRLAARPHRRFGRQLSRRIPFLLLPLGRARRPFRRTRPARVHGAAEIVRSRRTSTVTRRIRRGSEGPPASRAALPQPEVPAPAGCFPGSAQRAHPAPRRRNHAPDELP